MLCAFYYFCRSIFVWKYSKVTSSSGKMFHLTSPIRILLAFRSTRHYHLRVHFHSVLTLFNHIRSTILCSKGQYYIHISHTHTHTQFASHSTNFVCIDRKSNTSNIIMIRIFYPNAMYAVHTFFFLLQQEKYKENKDGMCK